MRWAFSLGFLLTLAGLSHAAPRVNSGGGGWVCRKNDGTGKVIWIKAADLTKIEYYNKRGLKIPFTGDRWEILKASHEMIKKRVPQLAKILVDHPFDIENKLFPVPYALNYIPDAQLRYKPLGSSCPDGVISYVQLADATMDGKVAYSSRVWEDPGFSEFHKAAILLHEQIYFALRETYGDESSYRTRQVMGLLFYLEDDDYLQKEIAAVLSAPARVSPGIFGFKSGPALFNVQLRCGATLDGERQMPAWSPTTFGEPTEFRYEGFRFKVTTSPIDNSPLTMEVTDRATGLQAVLVEADVVATFNALKRVTVTLKRDSRHQAMLWCSSKSPLDEDPL